MSFRMRLQRSVVALALGFFFSTALFISQASAGLSEFGVGGSYSTVMGSVHDTLGKATPLGLQAEFWTDLGLSPSVFGLVSVSLQKYDVKNIVNPSASVFFLGGFAGLEYRPLTKDSAFMVPSIAAQVGGVYDWLSFSDVSTPVQNAAMNAALQLVPGTALILADKLSLGLEFPVTLVFTKTPAAFWSASASLRLKL